MKSVDVDALVGGIRDRDRASVARAITLVESTAERHRPAARALLAAILPWTGAAVRVGLTGVPGVGKSTFIDAFGSHLVALGHRVAVIAVDPSSPRTGGSILGDKTRMTRLAALDEAFVRPAPASGALGGVARHTRESLLVLEAAGFDVVVVETVGVGQSETVVADMTDVFVALMLPGAGDELQGIKRGLLEKVDVVVVNKADGEQRRAAERAARQLQSAMSLFHPRYRPSAGDSGRASEAANPGALGQVQLCSALHGEGVAEVWQEVVRVREAAAASGELEKRRSEQATRWMWAIVEDGLRHAFIRHPQVAARWRDVESAVAGGAKVPTVAAEELLALFAPHT